ncbi:MAG: HemX protein [Candidatus Omnitrophota bacterium]|jgi:HemX protein
MNIEKFFLIALFFYVLSILLAIGSKRMESRLSLPGSSASYFLSTGVVGLLLIVRSLGPDHGILSDYFAGMLFAILILGIVYLLVGFKIKLPFAPAALSAFSILLGAMAIFHFDSTTDATLNGPFLKGHIYLMFAAIAAYSFSCLFAVLYLLQENIIKKKKIGALFINLPPLEATSRMNFIALAIGTSALFAGVLGGMTHIAKTSGLTSVLWEPATLLAFVMTAVYIALVFIRKGPMERARTMSYTSIICYCLMLIVFMGAHR